MAKKGNKYAIGALALAAIVILIMGLLSLGIMNYFQPEILFMTATENSVQGLKVGSNVKIKGVTIGAVKNIRIGLQGETIYITMKIDLNAVLNHSQDEFILKKNEAKRIFEQKIEGLIRNGLRCQLQYEGITGDMYIDLAYFDPKEYPVSNVVLPEHHPIFISMVPTASIGNIIDSTSALVKKLNDINFKKVSDNFNSLILAMNDFTIQLKKITNEQKINQLGDNINYSLSKFNQMMTSMNVLIKTIQMQPASVVWGKAGNKVVPSLNNE